MRVTWLGQAGLFIQTKSLGVLIDPYLSDSVGQLDPAKRRRRPAEPWMFDLQPDVLIFTHDHLDHYDPQTAEHFLSRDRAMTVLGPGACWEKARARGGGHNCVLFERGTQWTQGGVRFTAVTAVHSDPTAIGVVLQGEGVCLYITGDTLYSGKILTELPGHIDAVFLPVNGVGNNMNPEDAARFAADCGAKLTVPIHWGLLDELDPSDAFAYVPQYGGTLEIGEKQ